MWGSKCFLSFGKKFCGGSVSMKAGNKHEPVHLDGRIAFILLQKSG